MYPSVHTCSHHSQQPLSHKSVLSQICAVQKEKLCFLEATAGCCSDPAGIPWLALNSAWLCTDGHTVDNEELHCFMPPVFLRILLSKRADNHSPPPFLKLLNNFISIFFARSLKVAPSTNHRLSRYQIVFAKKLLVRDWFYNIRAWNQRFLSESFWFIWRTLHQGWFCFF